MTEPTLQNAFLFRQPILNGMEELAGYQLSFDSGEEGAAARSHTGSGATAALCAAYSELGMQSALGNSCAFIGIDSDFLQERTIELLPPAGVVLELMLDGVPDKETLARCHHLRDRGYALALARYRGIDDRSRPLLRMLQVIKIDIDAASESELRDLSGSRCDTCRSSSWRRALPAASRWRAAVAWASSFSRDATSRRRKSSAVAVSRLRRQH
jgi:c-di-GMP-related signal transduction protein